MICNYYEPPPLKDLELRASVVHKIRELFKFIYSDGKKLPKGDKLGIRVKTEQACLDCLHLSIEAALTPAEFKRPLVERLRTQIEMCKQMIRLEMEIGTLSEKTYLSWQGKLQEISLMTNGWINHLNEKRANKGPLS